MRGYNAKRRLSFRLPNVGFRLPNVGQVYEDCGYIPRLCVESNPQWDELTGINLFDGTTGSCRVRRCGPTLMHPLLVGLRLRNKEKFLEAKATWNSDWSSPGLHEYMSEEYKEFQALLRAENKQIGRAHV